MRAHSAPFKPFGWGRNHFGYCYKEVLPPRDWGVYVTLHRDLSPFLQRKDTKSTVDGYRAARKSFHENRRVLTDFYGGKLLPRRVIRENSKRLVNYDPEVHPPDSMRNIQPESPGLLTPVKNKPLYSAQEVEAIVKCLHQSHKNEIKFFRITAQYGMNLTVAIEDESSEGKDKDSPRGKVKVKICPKKSKYTCGEVDALIKCLTEYDRKRWAGGHPRRVPPFLNQISQDVRQCEKKLTEGERREVSSRLMSPRQRRSPSAQGPGPQGRSSPQRSQEEIESIISRLNQYDSTRWPPESKGQRPQSAL